MDYEDPFDVVERSVAKIGGCDEYTLFWMGKCPIFHIRHSIFCYIVPPPKIHSQRGFTTKQFAVVGG